MADIIQSSLSSLDSFGHVAAEDDTVLTYFLATDAVRKMESGDVMLALGRKGTGKTAMVRHVTEQSSSDFSRSLNLRNYPWTVHQARADAGASSMEAYVDSWRYVIAAQLASVAVSRNYVASAASEFISNFLKDNYGDISPVIGDLLRPPRLKLSKLSFEPSYGGRAWSFKYTDENSGWDNGASRFKVHLGLKEFAKLREERQPQYFSATSNFRFDKQVKILGVCRLESDSAAYEDGDI